MPLACVINGHFLALHGGISPEIQNCLQINQINRVQEPPLSGGLCDILWSDPVDNTTGLQSNVWTFNESRGCSYYFGYHAISEFLRRNELVTLIRAHEAQFDGFKAYVWQNWQFPQVITIFSAPNYCGTYANKGALIKLSGNEMKIHQYNST
jgi:serine/threonine-protein phosphatase 2B catalytic subunit